MVPVSERHIIRSLLLRQSSFVSLFSRLRIRGWGSIIRVRTLGAVRNLYNEASLPSTRVEQQVRYSSFIFLFSSALNKSYLWEEKEKHIEYHTLSAAWRDQSPSNLENKKYAFNWMKNARLMNTSRSSSSAPTFAWRDDNKQEGVKG